MNRLLPELAQALAQGGIADPGAEADLIWQAAIRQSAIEPQLLATTLVERRLSGTPLAYLTGRQTFLGVELLAEEGVLVPREETELLANTAISLLVALDAAPRVIDMCCGAGNLACAIAHHLPRARVWASDLTDECVNLARRNVIHTGVADRVNVGQGDLFGALEDAQLNGTIDMIVCNPPYISSKKLDNQNVALLEHEPREAFDGGPYGLSIHQRVIRDALRFLRPDGLLLFEFGLGQSRQLELLFNRESSYDKLTLVENSTGDARVSIARKLS